MNNEALAGWITALGISDHSSGHRVAVASRESLLAAGTRGMQSASDYTTAHIVFSGLLARAQGFHEGVIAATDADNPYAAFTLLRAYAENTAAILFVARHPAQLDKLWREMTGRGIKIGRITNFAETRMPTFRHIYEDLSRYAHPHAVSILASTRIVGENGFAWQSAPSFKFEHERLLAYAWLVELTTATAQLLGEMAAVFGLSGPDGP